MSDNSRLLLQIENTVRQVNKEIINPEISAVSVENLEPIMKMVARARADYLKELLLVTEESGEEIPKVEAVNRLARSRKIYEELLAAAKALDIAIERGYLDVSS